MVHVGKIVNLRPSKLDSMFKNSYLLDNNGSHSNLFIGVVQFVVCSGFNAASDFLFSQHYPIFAVVGNIITNH